MPGEPVRRRLLVPALAVTALAAAACGGSSDASDTTAEAASQSQEATRTVEHFRGTTEVPADPRRVVVLDLGELDSAVALGVTPVGAVRAPVEEGLLSYLQPQLEDVELVGEIGEPDLEKIAALDPDLVLGSELRVADFYDELSAIAPTVFSETVGVAWKENFELHAEALGREDEAAEMLAEYEARAEEVGAKVPDDTEVSIVRFVPGEIRLYAQENFIGTVLDDTGIARPEAQDVPEFDVVVSPEQIDLAAGDVIFVGTYGDPAETDGPAVLGGPLWQKIPAVQAADVHEVDDDIWFLGTGVGAAELVLDELEQTLSP
jgi:iron complex transport system substrate-binding protein